MKTRQLLLPEHNIIPLYSVCVCMCAFANVCTCQLTFTSIYYPLRSSVDVGSRNCSHQNHCNWLLTTQTGTLCPPCPLPCITLSLLSSSSFPSLTHLLICSPSISLSLSCLCLLFPIYPSSSPPFPTPLLARWLVYHWDGCGIKDATLFLFFFSIAPSLPLSLPSLILVSSHCGAFNSSNHMVAESSWRCREAFIGASKHSCNNARQGSEFFITLMLDRADPSIPPGSPTAPTQTHSTPFPFS